MTTTIFFTFLSAAKKEMYQRAQNSSTVDPTIFQRKHQLPLVKARVAQTLCCFAQHRSMDMDRDAPSEKGRS